MMVLSRVLHHLVTLLSSSFLTNPRQVTSFTGSAVNTAVVEMNMSPGLVLVYLLLSPNIANCTVRVTRLRLGLLLQSFLEYQRPMINI